ncbi:MAG: peptidase M16 [Bacteroidetes bacterium]|nr:MAG: peptidase M16 [Bacteroidota bacterium]
MKIIRALLIHFFVLTVFSTFFSKEVFAQFGLSDKIPVDPQVRIGRLPNGLTYYIRRNRKPENKVQLRLVVNAGSILEDSDQQGLAHMMEHMNFNGSFHFPKNELVSYLQSIGVQFGADLNASTGFDETIYILPIPSDDTGKVDKGFTILEDWAGHALLDTNEINKERGVVLEESRLGKGANERMLKKYFPRLLNNSKYASRLPIGKDEIIQHFKPESLRRFYKTWYRPDLMAVIVVGDLDPAEAEKEIIRHFSGFKNPAPEQPRPPITAIKTRVADESMVVTDKEETNKQLSILYNVERSKPIITWADYRRTIVENLATAIINQRLNEMTQLPDPPFIFASVGFNDLVRGYRAFGAFAELGNKPVQTTIDSIVVTTESVRQYGFLQTELDRAKSNLLNETQKAAQNKDKTESANFVQEYIQHFLSQVPIPGIAKEFAFIQQILPGITLKEVNAVISELDNKQGKFVLLTAPEKDAQQLPGNQQLLAMFSAAHQLPTFRYHEKSVASSLLDKVPQTGKIISDSYNAFLGTLDLGFDNGITVTLRPTDFKNDEIKMDAWRWGGYRNYPLEDKENATYAAQIVGAMGVKDLSPVDLTKFLSGKTVSATPYLNPLEEGIEGSSSVKDFETFLQLVNLYFTAARKEEGLFKSFVSSQKSYLKNILANPFAFFSDSVMRIRYNNNPWAERLPRAEDFDKINLDRSFAIYKEIFGNAYGMHFTFVGNIDTNKVKSLLATYLGSLPAQQKEPKYTDVGLRPVAGVNHVTIHKGADQKSLVQLLFGGETTYNREEELKLKALVEVMNIKTIEKLREEMSGIYGGQTRGGFEKRPYGHYSISTVFPCGPENVEKLTAALFDLIKNAKEKGIEQKDLDKVKETWKKQNQDHLKENDFWLESLSRAWIDREDPAWILHFADKVDALTTKDLQDAANKYYDMNNYLKAVLMPEK